MEKNGTPTSNYYLINWLALISSIIMLLGFTHKKLKFDNTMIAGENQKLETMNMCSGKSVKFQGMMPMFWSDPATWGGIKPIAGQDVVIPEGMQVILDESTPALGGLTINGSLEFEDQNLSLTADWIMLMGTLQIGTEADPFTSEAIITLTADNTSENIMNMGTRGLMVMGGTLELHGNPTQTPWTKISQSAISGSSSLSLVQPVDWQAGDEIAIGPTDFYQAGNGASVSQNVLISSVNGAQIGLQTGLNAHRWGVLQYATENGISLNSSPAVDPPGIGFTPTVLDERAPVGHLSRNIIIQAPDDALWQSQGFGCHVMIMRLGNNHGVAHVNGVEIRRGGQRGLLGRYPFHWHMLSYEGSNTLNDASGQYIRNSSINRSAHRGIVIHGTNGVEVSNNVVYDIRGHGIFTEDASERRNLIDNNLVLRVRNAVIPLKQHETNERGASGFWLSNPDNTIINNTAADCIGNGFWLAFPTHPWGLSINVPINPSRIEFGIFDNNTAHSNRLEGIMLDNVEIDNAGNTFPFQYYSTSDGQNPQWPFSTLRRFALERYKTWKNGAMGIWDRATWVDNYEAVSADNCGRFFAGAGVDGIIERCLVVGTSLNHMMNGTGRPNFTGESVPAGFATYHSTFDIRDNIVMHFPAVANTKSGVFATEDYYIRAVDKGQMRNENNLMIESHPGVKLMASYPHFALAGALWDPHDNWGGSPAQDNYLVYDTPFYTYGQTPQTVPPANVTGGVLLEGPFYGFNDFIINEGNLSWDDLMAIRVKRLNQAMQTVGEWNVNQASPGWLLAHMRHFAAHPSGYYLLDFPGFDEVSDVGLAVENMLTVNDTLIIGIEYDADFDVTQVYTSTVYFYMDNNHENIPNSYAYKTVFEEVTDFNAVRDSDGEAVYWHDKSAGVVWMKIIGGMEHPWNPEDYAPTDDELLYRMFNLRIFGELGPLSADLLEFGAIPIGNEVLTHWTTENEIDVHSFTVERSMDAKSWQEIGRVSASNANTGERYELTDDQPFNGESYYRLKRHDVDGKFEYSGIVKVNVDLNSEVVIFPNPARHLLNIKMEDEEENVQIDIKDIHGKIVFSEYLNSNNSRDLDVSRLRSGNYFVELRTDNKVITKLLIKL